MPYLRVKMSPLWVGTSSETWLTFSDIRFYARSFRSLKHRQTFERPLLFESCVSDISVMNRVEAVRDTGPQILLELRIESTEPQWCFDRLKGWIRRSVRRTCLLGNYPLPCLHIWWRTTLDRSLKWTWRCWVQSLCPGAASEDSNLCHVLLKMQFSSGLDGSRLQRLVLSGLSLLSAGRHTPVFHFFCYSPAPLREVSAFFFF